MKRQVRFAGFSTGPVDLDRETMALVLVVARAPGYVESMAVGEVAVDGEDSADIMVALSKRVPQADQVRAAFSNATTVAGFNVIDTERFTSETRVPFIGVVRDRPDMDAIDRALGARFGSGGLGRRRDLLAAHRWEEIDGIHLTWSGVSREEALTLYRLSLDRGKVPEVLRIAHLVAGAVETGMSGGRVV
ncbi:MAG: DUF99 family protein [Thermoplasmata archaeon]|nr:DUF99 family protein [Thermoplasmata archaeon]